MNVKWILWIVDIVLAILVILGPKNRYRKVHWGEWPLWMFCRFRFRLCSQVHPRSRLARHPLIFLIVLADLCMFWDVLRDFSVKHCMVSDFSQHWLDFCKRLQRFEWDDVNTTEKQDLWNESFACQLQFTVWWFISFPSTRPKVLKTLRLKRQ